MKSILLKYILIALLLVHSSKTQFVAAQCGPSNALQFNGNSGRVNCGNPTNGLFNLLGDGTIEAWVKVVLSAPSNGVVLGKDNGSGNNMPKWFFGIEQGRLFFHINGPSYGGGYWVYSTPFTQPAATVWYHVAMTKQGNIYTFFVNGIRQGGGALPAPIVPTSAPLTIGWGEPCCQANHIIDEVKFWNTVRTNAEILQDMSDCPSANQVGLIAYYPMNDNAGQSRVSDLSANGNHGTLVNMNPTTAWVNGVQTACSRNPQLIRRDTAIYRGDSVLVENRWFRTNGQFVFLRDSTVMCSDTILVNITFKVTPSVVRFTAPDTVCVGEQVKIQNNSTGDVTNYWSFCSGGTFNTPQGTNLGNLGNLSGPHFIAIANDNGNWFAFIANHNNATVTRLSFGNSLLNTPTAQNLGNLGVLNGLTLGIQIKKQGANWYGFVVANSVHALFRLDFGTSLANTPTAQNLGNIGGLSSPHDLYIFEDNGTWYGLVVNAGNHSVTRFSFINGLGNPPTGQNLGNPNGILDYPVGIFPIKQGNNWHIFVANGNSMFLGRLDFGNSLLNVPTGVSLGNLNGQLSTSADLSILSECGNFVGFITQVSGKIMRLDFGNALTNTPTASAIPSGSFGLNFPIGLSDVFRVRDTLYFMVANRDGNAISRIYFPSCNNASIPSSTLRNPPPFSYNQAGSYTISLTINEGTESVSSVCKTIVVVDKKVFNQTFSLCRGETVAINGHSYSETGIYRDSLRTTAGCDSIVVTQLVIKPTPSVSLPKITVCNNGASTFTLRASNNPSDRVQWSDGQTTATITVSVSGIYSVIVTNTEGCSASDTTEVKFLKVTNLRDTTICKGNTVTPQKPTATDPLSIKLVDASRQPINSGQIQPTATTGYFWQILQAGVNLIKNGDFERGNQDFSSGYFLSRDVGLEGSYAIDTNPQLYHRFFPPCASRQGPSRKYMFVNGSLVPNTTVWQQTLKVQPNTPYAFSVWVVSLSRPEIPALLQFALVFPNGTTTPLGAIYTAPPTSCNWEQHFETWMSGSQDSVVTLRLVNQNTDMGGNDFGIDDLSFAAICASEHPFTVEVRTTDSTRLTLATCDPAQVGETSVRLRNRFGCDSLVVTRRILNTQAPRIETRNATTCRQSEVRIQRDTFRNGICDTLIRMTNTRLQSNLPEKRIDIISCAATSTTSVYDTIRQIGSCDTVRITTTRPARKDNILLNTTLCAHDSVFFNGAWRKTSGIFTQTLRNTEGCDSTVRLTLSVQTIDTTRRRETICADSAVLFNGILRNKTGIYTALIKDANRACSTFTVLDLTVRLADTATTFQTICKGDTVLFFSKKLTISGIYTENSRNTEGCLRQRRLVLTVLPNPYKDVYKSKDTSITLGDSLRLFMPDLPFSPKNWRWTSPQFLPCDTCPMPFYHFLRTQTLARVSIRDSNGCKTIAERTYRIHRDIYIPNAFSPNDDGKNDRFTIYGKPQLGRVVWLHIYGRWGNHLFFNNINFELNDADAGWDGTFQGQPLPPDVFMYQALIRFVNGEEIVYKGDVTLVR